MSEDSRKDNNEIELVYKPKENVENMRIFGGSFVHNNKNKCHLIYKDKKYDLKEYFNEIDEDYNNKDIISIKLTGVNNIIYMINMFTDCNSIISLPDISNLNTSNVKKMNYMFSGCDSIISLPDISGKYLKLKILMVCFGDVNH